MTIQPGVWNPAFRGAAGWPDAECAPRVAFGDEGCAVARSRQTLTGLPRSDRAA